MDRPLCAGGRIKNISKCNDIEVFNQEFLKMVRSYLKVLYPYRNTQEQISEAVKAFGGIGTIHGCIIDINFYNHIMLNPQDGCITYYFSSIFGKVERHENLLALLEAHNRKLEERYRKQIEKKEFEVLESVQPQFSREIVKIDIKNSLYSVSNRMNQLQRLFDKKVLRDWNEIFLKERDVYGLSEE